jgi:rhodanese-related sulfurtransferase
MAVTRISPGEAAEKLAEGWVYVDVRSEDEFEEGHPAGALNVPYTRDEPRFVDAVRAKAGDGAKLVLGCKSGIVSVHAAEMLARAGFEVLEQRAGFDGSRGTFGQLAEPGWARAGLPVERTEEEEE